MLEATVLVSARPQSREYNRDLAFPRFPLDLGWESKVVYIRRGEARIGSQVVLADFPRNSRDLVRDIPFSSWVQETGWSDARMDRISRSDCCCWTPWHWRTKQNNDKAESHQCDCCRGRSWRQTFHNEMVTWKSFNHSLAETAWTATTAATAP